MTTCWRCGLKVDERPTGSKQWADYHAHQNYCIDMLRAENERLRAVLRAVEWIADYDGVRWCPSCQACHPEHVSTCQLKAALDAAGGAE